MKCQICKTHKSEWSWQPFGPDESPLSFTTPGSHYRGFTVVKICDACKQNLESGKPVEFIHKNEHYTYDGASVQWMRERSA